MTLSQGHRDWSHENNKCLIVSETIQAMSVPFAVKIVRLNIIIIQGWIIATIKQETKYINLLQQQAIFYVTLAWLWKRVYGVPILFFIAFPGVMMDGGTQLTYL